MIEINNLTKIYNTKRKNKVIALSNINLKIGNKGLIFIVGKSGSGKSTLLNLLGGLDESTSGEIKINGKNINKFNEQELDSYRNTYIGFVFQEFNLLEEYNVYQNIELASKLQNETPSLEYISKLLKLLGIENLENRKINELSGGQKQRVAIARALIKNPQIILADEPTGNLDTNSSRQTFEILKSISKERLVIVISHDIKAANEYADRIIRIEDGKVIEDTKLKEENEINNKFELKKSKLPFSYAIKLSTESLKHKNMKLFFTILLTSVSFLFMSIMLTFLLFNENKLIIKTMKDNNSYIYRIHKVKYYNDLNNENLHEELKLTNNDINDIKKINNNLNIAYNLYDNFNNINFEFGESDFTSPYFIEGNKYQINLIDVKDDRIIGNIIGNKINKQDEIIIHKYLADVIIKYGIKLYDENMFYPKNYEEIVSSNNYIKLGDNKVKIVGIIDEDNSLFKKQKELNIDFDNDELKNYYYETYFNNGRFVYTKGLINNIKLNNNKLNLINQINIYNDIGSINDNINILNKNISVKDNNSIKDINSLKSNEIILSVDSIRKIVKNFDTLFLDYYNLNNGDYNEELINFSSTLINKIKDINIMINDNIYDNLTIVGVSFDKNNYISKNIIDNYEIKEKEIYSIYVYDDNIFSLNKAFNKIDYFNTKNCINKNDIHYSFELKDESINYNISKYINMNNNFKIYIIIISFIFIIFSFMLFSNFIFISIINNRKQIGILRSLGARNKDIIKIYIYESIIIGLVSVIISGIMWIIVCNVLNNIYGNNMYYLFNPIILDPLVQLIMIIYSILISLLVTSLLITKTSKIKPIDAINK